MGESKESVEPIIPQIVYDDYGEVVTRPETCMAIAEILGLTSKCAVGWTDEMGTHLDILFVADVSSYGHFQRGIQPASDLLVSIMGFGAFGFDLEGGKLFGGYVNEKFGGRLGEATAQKVAELIGGVREAYLKV